MPRRPAAKQRSRTRSAAPAHLARKPTRQRPRGRPAVAPATRVGTGPRAPAPYRARTFVLRDGRAVRLRTIRPEDDVAIERAFQRLSPRSRYLRLMQHKRQLDPRVLARGVRPEAGREFVLVATVADGSGYDIVGAARYVQSDDPAACEFAITVADEWTGQGLAATLLRRLVRRARTDGYARIEGVVLPYNDAMLALARGLHFEIRARPGDATLMLVQRRLMQA
jgi:RimJ/RimL family protein N-acetyltransferase